VVAIKLGLVGADGRMGKSLREHLTSVNDIHVHSELEAGGSVPAFVASRPDVVVDLSVGASVDIHGLEIVKANIPYIIGATGVGSNTLDMMAGLAEDSNTPVLLVPNFSLGANLMICFAAKAAALMEFPVITERHHEKKADAPSGTALFTAKRITEAVAGEKPQATEYAENIEGVMGGHVNGVALHSIRGSGYLAEQEVCFSLPGESLSIEHRSIDRKCFMSGIVYAIRNINKATGLSIGLDTILEI